MPEISRFYGIIITMFINDHTPPHYHVRYGNYRAIVTIDGIVRGEMPAKVIKLVSEWAELHHLELISNWGKLQTGKEISKIEPLN